MKKYYFMRKHALTLILSLFIVSSAVAQQQRPRHYLGGWLFTGYSAMFHNIENTSLIGGGGVGIGGGYQLRKGAFLFNTGLEFEFINSATKVKGLDGQTPILDTECDSAMFHYQFYRFRDIQNYGIVNVPILFGAQFPAGKTNIYFLAGGKVGMAVLGTYSTSGSMKTWGVYNRYIDPFEDMINHYYHEKHSFKNLVDKNAGYTNKSALGMLNVMASFELGMELNPYIFKVKKDAAKKGQRPAKPAPRVKGAKQQPEFKKEEPRIRIALFADYGVLNINKNIPKGGEALIKPNRGEDWFGPDGEIKKALPTQNLLATTGAFLPNGKPKSVNPFMVGIKGTVFFDVTKPPKPPIIKEEKPIPPPPMPIFYITGKIINVETGKVVTTASVDMFSDKGAKVFSAKPNTGIFNTKLDRKGTYKVNVTAPNYNPYSETFGNIGDTMMIYIEPIRVNTNFIIKNIFFEFDRTILIETSNKALDELADFLKENPGVYIKIVGHTDNKGSDAYNQRLSEGRAKAVVDALIARGIEPERLTWEGRAARDPITTNDTDEGRAENRRVEFIVTDVK